MSGFQFLDYRLRVATEEDREHCQRWIDQDPSHVGKVKAEFFLQQEPGVEAMVLEDKDGQPVFYFRMARAIKVDIQFGPAGLPIERVRNMEAMRDGLAWLRLRCQEAVIRNIYFESQAPLLARFAERRLGFEKSPYELVAAVDAPLPRQDEQRDQENTAHHELTEVQEGI